MKELRKPKRSIKDLSGLRVGRLEVLSFAGVDNRGCSYFNCKCDCGEKKILQAGHLVQGAVQSCGCLRRETRLTHGLHKHPLYQTWYAIIKRCRRESWEPFKNYGARGIAVCDRWANSFPAFLEDMGERPSPKHQVERSDNNGPYCKENCVWATGSQQARNRRSNRLITAFGQTKTMVEWGEELGLRPDTIQKRLNRGKSPEDALSLTMGPSRW